MGLSTILFYAFAIMIIIFAVLTVSSNNVVHSALYMVATFFIIACIYILLYAEFLAIVQVLVYIGSISILMIFGVMLTRRGNISESNLPNKYRIISIIVSLAIFLTFLRYILLTKWTQNLNVVNTNDVKEISNLFMTNFLIPFEVSAILLLIALIGAIIIGKGMSKLK